MAKTQTVTFLGDADPNVQSVEMFGRTFVKGQSVTLKDSDAGFAKITANPTFSTESGADVIESEEPEAPNPDEGTELQALRDDLDARGVKYPATAGVDALRKKLASSVEG